MKFDATWSLILQDKKTQTTRPVHQLDWYRDHPATGKKVKVEADDPRCPEETEIMLTQVFKARLGDVASNAEHYVREGFSSGQEFVDTWKRLHGNFDPEQEVCVIRFVRV